MAIPKIITDIGGGVTDPPGPPPEQRTTLLKLFTTIRVSAREGLTVSRIDRRRKSLALIQKECLGKDGAWCPVRKGLVVPMDAVPELIGALQQAVEAVERRY